MSAVGIHPLVDHGVKQGSASFSGATLSCKCTKNPVKVTISNQVAHNHACGCTKCWKPEGAIFSVVAVVPSDRVKVVENADKLAVVDANALIQRHALQDLRRTYVWPSRERGAPILRPDVYPSRVVR